MSHKKRTAKPAATKPTVSKKMEATTTNSSPYVFQRDKIAFDLSIRELPWTQKQKDIIESFQSKKTKVMFLKGVAGTSKTTLGMYCGLQLLNQRRVSDLVLVRSAVESSDSKLGFLPGDLSEKFNIYLTPFNDKFSELLSKPQIDKLEKEQRITMCPINFARGLHWSAQFICCDESQNFSLRELNTLMTRVGEFCKIIICGDPEQSDLPYGKSGFTKVYDAFNNPESVEHGIICHELTEEDIVRSELCKFVVHKFKEINIDHNNIKTH
jgi:phosphate starvation-inducible PhoH-like protein